MSDRLIIIGAGMAGLLAGNILRRTPLQIVEKQASLPNNHHAVLRFRTTKVSEQVHVPFRQVTVFKGIDEHDPIKAAMRYAYKVTGNYEVRSLINLEPAQRYIAPPDLIEQMAIGLDIAYGVDGLCYCSPEKREEMKMSPIISTLPMPMLMDALEYPSDERPDFTYSAGSVIKARIRNCDMFATRYYTQEDSPLYRASITGDNLILEYVGPIIDDNPMEDLDEIASDFGIWPEDVYDVSKLKVSKYGKLAALSESDKALARQFMFWASTNWNVFSLGRFAKWQAGLLMDDVVQDVMKIEKWINSSLYELKKEI
jgi:hypothetical protein